MGLDDNSKIVWSVDKIALGNLIAHYAVSLLELLELFGERKEVPYSDTLRCPTSIAFESKLPNADRPHNPTFHNISRHLHKQESSTSFHQHRHPPRPTHSNPVHFTYSDTLLLLLDCVVFEPGRQNPGHRGGDRGTEGQRDREAATLLGEAHPYLVRMAWKICRVLGLGGMSSMSQ